MDWMGFKAFNAYFRRLLSNVDQYHEYLPIVLASFHGADWKHRSFTGTASYDVQIYSQMKERLDVVLTNASRIMIVKVVRLQSLS